MCIRDSTHVAHLFLRLGWDNKTPYLQRQESYEFRTKNII